ncbi:MAG TPA: hypothetical protein VHJ77_13945 [Vicinamibacterales bacterium]|jgi:hypothetical protein|nr:hypothetical protein [Vicinamibacterales bacterium]
MSDNLHKFLIALASDPDLMDRFEADPRGELNKAGLTSTEKAAVLTHDPAELRTALGNSPTADVLTRVLKHPRRRRKARKAARKVVRKMRKARRKTRRSVRKAPRKQRAYGRRARARAKV